MVNKLNKSASRDIRPPQTFLGDSASARSSVKQRTSNIDDIIRSLSEAHENKRARQVVEWVRQQSVRRAA
ncbi:MAG TPA: hypothetical protein PKD24_06085 [Pyrinomonadaceae bacterium]|nr:hypothetical protein [Pyrinomonadaceae bacterium]